MYPNDLFAADLDAVFSTDYAGAYRAGLCALFYADGTHLASVQVAGSMLDECPAVAALGAAAGADQAMWFFGALVTDRPLDEFDPDAYPALAYLAVRRDGEAGAWRRILGVVQRRKGNGHVHPPALPEPYPVPPIRHRGGTYLHARLRRVRGRDPMRTPSRIQDDCPRCGGNCRIDRVGDRDWECPRCKGTGVVWVVNEGPPEAFPAVPDEVYGL